MHLIIASDCDNDPVFLKRFHRPLCVGTSRRWSPFRPSKTGNCKNFTDSSARSKTRGRVCPPPCRARLRSPRRLSLSRHVGTGRLKSSSGPGLTLTWTTTESPTRVKLLTTSFVLPFLPLCSLLILSSPSLQVFSSPAVSLEVSRAGCPSTVTQTTTLQWLLKEVNFYSDAISKPSAHLSWQV